jgi:hypothetical protein
MVSAAAVVVAAGPAQRMLRNRGLTYHIHDEVAAFRFRLAGDLVADSTVDLDQARQTAASVFAGRPLVADLTGIENIDAAGRELLDKWRHFGAQFVATSREAKVRILAMTGIPCQLVERRPDGFGTLAGRAAAWLLPVMGRRDFRPTEVRESCSCRVRRSPAENTCLRRLVKNFGAGSSPLPFYAWRSR